MIMSKRLSSSGMTRSNDLTVLNYYNYLLKSSDVVLLTRNDWLNDVLIGFYFEYLNRLYRTDENNHLLFIGPEVTQLLKMQDPTQFNTFLDPLEAGSYTFLFFPVNDCNAHEAGGSHWSLLIYSSIEKLCYHFDSSRGTNSSAAENLANNVIEYFHGKRETSYVEIDCPQQNNAYDCGLFVLCLADIIARYVLTTPNSDCDFINCDLTELTHLVSRKRYNLMRLIYDLKKRYNTET